MIFANPLPDGIVCASILAAFLFIAMFGAHTAGCMGKVRTLWI
jgi:hypothetical protein